MTETVPSSMFGTHSSPPIQADASGFVPTGIRASTAPVAGSSRTTSFASVETQRASADGVIQSAFGTGKRATTRFRRTSTFSTLSAAQVGDPDRAERVGDAVRLRPGPIFATTLFFFGLIRRSVRSLSLVTQTLPPPKASPYELTPILIRFCTLPVRGLRRVSRFAWRSETHRLRAP